MSIQVKDAPYDSNHWHSEMSNSNKTVETLKKTVIARGRRCGDRNEYMEYEISMKNTLYNTIIDRYMPLYICLHHRIEHHEMNPNVNYYRLLMIICQYKFINCGLKCYHSPGGYL